MSEFITLLEIIRQIESLDESSSICISGDLKLLKLDSKCFLASDKEIDGHFLPEEYSFFIGLYSVKDIIFNLKEQTNEITENKILAAINFFIENDAFVQLPLGKNADNK